jgi:hypothetical protein
MKYTAILTVSRRDVNSASPKRMLHQIREVESKKLFRDHLWIQEEIVDKYLPTNDHRMRAVIEFTAEPKEYMSSDGVKLGLTNIKNIKILKTFKVIK